MKSTFLTALFAGVVLGGCDAARRQQQAMGDVTSLIIVAADSVWTQVGGRIEAALEPEIFAVRDETTFEITWVSPADPHWLELQRFRQVVAIGTAEDTWVREVLGKEGSPGPLPGIVERDDVWARGQSITAVVLPAENAEEALLGVLRRLESVLDDRFRQYALSRMFASDTNRALRDSLPRVAGFSITLPAIYQAVQIDDSLFAFHSRTEVGGDLFRTIIAGWRSGVHANLTAEDVLAWREQVVPRVFEAGQATSRERVESRVLEGAPDGSIEVQAVWAGTDPAFPTGGPFIDRVVVCPDQQRTYFLEAWMYGPSRRKYEYMIQFENILNSFRCGAATG